VNIFVNGRIIDEQQATVSVLDHGFLYGMGLFETFRTYGGRPFLLNEHMDRLRRGCEELGIAYDPVIEDVAVVIQELLEANQLTDAYVRWTVTGGAGILGLPAEPYNKPTIVCYMKELPPRKPEADESGKPIQLLQLRRNSPEGTIRHKSLHYMNNILGKKELGNYPWLVGRQAEGLFLDGGGHLAEGLVSNLFFIDAKREVVRTPSLLTGILPGITRDAVMELAEQGGYRVEQGLYTWEELKQADEIFLTNSIQEIVPVTELFDIDGARSEISSGRIGPVTRKLLDDYRRLADTEASNSTHNGGGNA
jgi:4-amino-4-deoxychorismate lyase